MKKIIISLIVLSVLLQGAWICFQLHNLVGYNRQHQIELQIIRNYLDLIHSGIESMKEAVKSDGN